MNSREVFINRKSLFLNILDYIKTKIENTSYSRNIYARLWYRAIAMVKTVVP